MIHIVRAGDTLFGISRNYGVSVDQIRAWNNLRTDSLALGQQLRVAPVSGAVSQPVSNTPSNPVARPVTPTQPQPVNLGGSEFQAIMNARRVFGVSVANMGTFNNYTVTYPLPLGGSDTARFRDNIPSGHAIYRDGVSYVGKSSPRSVPLDAFISVGLTPAQARALKYVSENEGNFDAINSYDKAIFSYGFIQFAGGAGGGLGAMLMLVKGREPQVFRQMFGQYGIEVEQASPRPIIVAAAPETGRILRGDDACMYIKDNKQLTTAFIAAGFHPSIMLAQIESAARGYVNPALGIRLNLQIGNQLFNNVPVTQIIRSEAAVATLIDLTVNQWIVRTGAFFKAAIEEVAAQDRLFSLDQLAHIDERRVLASIVNNATDARVRQRTEKMLNSGLGFAK